jgi:hypothetical protein
MKNTKNRDADLMFSRAKLHQTLQNHSLHSHKIVCERFERIWWRKHEEQSERKWVFVNGFLIVVSQICFMLDSWFVEVCLDL